MNMKMARRQKIDPNCVSLDRVVDESYKLLGLIKAYKKHSIKGYYDGIYSDIVQGFGAWRIALARIIELECRGRVKSSFEFIDEIGELPRQIVETVKGRKPELIDSIERILHLGIIQIEKNKNKFKSNKDGYFARDGLVIDLETCSISYFVGKRSKKVTFLKDKQVYKLLKVLLKNGDKRVTHARVVKACFPKYKSSAKDLKSMEIFKLLDDKLKQVGIESEKRPYYISTDGGYRLIINEK